MSYTLRNSFTVADFAASHNYVCSVFGKDSCDSHADAAASSGNKRNFSSKIEKIGDHNVSISKNILCALSRITATLSRVKDSVRIIG